MGGLLNENDEGGNIPVDVTEELEAMGIHLSLIHIYAISNMKNFRFSTTISVAAAFCAYFIGSGFASGQELSLIHI